LYVINNDNQLNTIFFHTSAT
jgi:hypothetical protein